MKNQGKDIADADELYQKIQFLQLLFALQGAYKLKIDWLKIPDIHKSNYLCQLNMYHD